MRCMQTVKDILSLFPSQVYVARICGVSRTAVSLWVTRGIPLNRALILSETPELQNAGISLRDLMAINDRLLGAA